MLKHVLTTTLALMALTVAAFAQLAVPALTGRVVDNANILSAQTEARLTARLAAHETKSGNQIAVLTIPSLQGESLEQYSLKVAREWALGNADFDTGALLFVSKNDRKLRIEVGYGLEGQLTDAIASFIIRNRITPHFKQGDFNAGIRQGVSAMIDVLEADKAALERWQERAAPKNNWSDEGDGWIGIVFVTLWLMIFFGSFLSGLLVRRFGKEIKPGHYRWMGMDAGPNAPRRKRRRNIGGVIMGGGGFGGRSGGFGGGGFSGGGGGFGGGGSSGSW